MTNEALPSSPAAEACVLSCMATRGTEAIALVLEAGVGPSAFAVPLNRRVFDCIMQIHARGLPVSVDAVWHGMQFVSEDERADYLKITSTADDTFLSLPALCTELRKCAMRRQTILLAGKLMEAAQHDSDEVSGLVGQLLSTQAQTSAARPWTNVCDAAKARAVAAIAGQTTADEFLSWRWPNFDARFKPLRRGELVIIAARPSVGKSSLLRAIAYKSAIAGHHVLVESLEVSGDDVADQMATALSSQPAARLHALHAADQRDFLAALDRLKAAPLHVFEDRTLAGIVARVKAVHASRRIDLLAIDYLGLVEECEPSRGETKAQAVGRVTKALKRLAMELNIVVLCAAQLNRGPAADGNREPRLSDLRDSGDIEQDADRVVFIHRPDECPISKRQQDVLDTVDDCPRFGVVLLQSKGRNVGTGHGACWFNRELARFDEA